MVFFTPVELAASAQRGQEAGLLTALERAEAAVKQAGKLLGGMPVPGRSVEQMFSSGYDLVCTTSDVIMLRSTAENLIRSARPPRSSEQALTIRFVTPPVPTHANGAGTLLQHLRRSGRDARVLGAMTRLGSAVESDAVVLDHERGCSDLLGAVGL